jgi:hypothetical protein
VLTRHQTWKRALPAASATFQKTPLLPLAGTNQHPTDRLRILEDGVTQPDWSDWIRGNGAFRFIKRLFEMCARPPPIVKQLSKTTRI